MTSGEDHEKVLQRSDRRRVALHLLATPFFFALMLFLPAGTWAWWNGWIFILVFLSVGTAAGLYVVRVNPEILTARSRIQEGTKGWDRILLGFLFPTMCRSSRWRPWTTGGSTGSPCPGGSVASATSCLWPEWGSRPGRKP